MIKVTTAYSTYGNNDLDLQINEEIKYLSELNYCKILDVKPIDNHSALIIYEEGE